MNRRHWLESVTGGLGGFAVALGYMLFGLEPFNFLLTLSVATLAMWAIGGSSSRTYRVLSLLAKALATGALLLAFTAFEPHSTGAVVCGWIYWASISVWFITRVARTSPARFLSAVGVGVSFGLICWAWFLIGFWAELISVIFTVSLHFSLLVWEWFVPWEAPDQITETPLNKLSTRSEWISFLGFILFGGAFTQLAVAARTSLFQPGAEPSLWIFASVASLMFALGAALATTRVVSFARLNSFFACLALALLGSLYYLSFATQQPLAGAWDGDYEVGRLWNYLFSLCLTLGPVALAGLGSGAFIQHAFPSGRTRKFTLVVSGVAAGSTLLGQLLVWLDRVELILCLAIGLAILGFFKTNLLLRAIALVTIGLAGFLWWQPPQIYPLLQGARFVEKIETPYAIAAVVETETDGTWLLENGSWVDSASVGRDRDREATVKVGYYLQDVVDEVLIIGDESGRLAERFIYSGMANQAYRAQSYESSFEEMPTTEETRQGEKATLSWTKLHSFNNQEIWKGTNLRLEPENTAYEPDAVEIMEGQPERWLRKSGKQFDLIVFNPYDLRRSEDLKHYRKSSLEQFREALTEDGIWLGWLPVRGLGDPQFKSILKTVYDTFEVVKLVYVPEDPSERLIFVGANTPLKFNEQLLDDVYKSTTSILPSTSIPEIAPWFRDVDESLFNELAEAQIYDASYQELELELQSNKNLSLPPAFIRWLKESKPGAVTLSKDYRSSIQKELSVNLEVTNHLTQGHLYLWQGLRGAARHEYTRALETDPNNDAARRLLGYAPELERYLADQAALGNLEAHREWARRLANRKAWEEAEQQWREIVDKNPNHTESQVALAQVLEETGRADEAFKIYEELWTRDLIPQERVLVRRVAEVNRWKLERKAGGGPESVLNQVEAFLKEDDPFRAIRLLEEDDQLHETPALLATLGDLYLQQGMMADVSKTAEALRKMDALPVTQLRFRVEVLRSNNEIEKAWKVWNEIPADQQSATTYYLGAQLQALRGQPKEAERLLIEAVARGGDPTRYRAMKDTVFSNMGIEVGRLEF